MGQTTFRYENNEYAHVGDFVEFEIPPLRALYWGTLKEVNNKLFIEEYGGGNIPVQKCKLKRKLNR